MRAGTARSIVLMAILARATAAAEPLTVRVVDVLGRPVPDAVVHADAPAAAAAVAPEARGDTEITQLDKRFVPFVQAVAAGSAVRFTNRDSINHHVYSFSAPKQFSLKLRRNADDAPAVRFERPGVVVLGCNIHDWMLGYLVVLDTPVFGVTDASGSAVLALPAEAPQALQVWHPRIDGAPLRIDIEAEGDVAVLRVPRLGPDPRPKSHY